jgi:hypothetical protein
MLTRKFISLFLILIIGSTSALAENVVDLSFMPFKTCKKPPVSPSNKLLKRGYKTYIYAGSWAIFDINGDGWCDWVRGGNEGYRSDQEYPPLREFIYLGTAKGWRHFDQPKDKKNLKIDIGGSGVSTVLSGDYAALNFVEPIPIYSKWQSKPYIATVIRYDAPAPPPSRESIDVYQWNDAFDKLHKVPEKDRLVIVNFLHDKLCKHPAELLSDGDSPFLLAQGELCYPRQ